MVRLKTFNLLFLENNKEFALNTIQTLEFFFNTIYHTSTIKKALEIYSDYRVDVIISDVKVNDGNGLEFIKKVRAEDKDIPIVILSAHKDEEFLFQAITLNLLSYELKPLSYNDFLQVLDKIDKQLNINETFLLEQDISYNFITKELTVFNENIRLTKKEILFLELLAKNSTKVLTYELIQKNVWEENTMTISALKNFILRLRKKAKITQLLSLANIGYKLTTE